MRKILAGLVLICGLREANVVAQGCSTEKDPATRTKVGQTMPSFTVTDRHGKPFSIEAQRGKVVLIDFWATWCPPCQEEIPRLEKEIWQKYKDVPNFAMIGIAREQTDADIVPFAKKRGFSYPIAGDPGRSMYKLFAESGIPRIYLVGQDGKILFQTVGYCPDDFVRLKKLIDQTLAGGPH